jgi:hypothetical protein
VFEGRVLKKIFGSEREKLRKDCRKLHNNGFRISPLTNIIGVIKYRTLICSGQVGYVEERKMQKGFCRENWRDHVGSLRLNGSLI